MFWGGYFLSPALRLGPPTLSVVSEVKKLPLPADAALLASSELAS